MTVFFIKGLNRGGIIYESNHGIAVIRRLAAFYKDLIAVEDSDIDHGITLNLQGKRFTARHHFRRYREVALNILFRQNRLPGRYLPNHRNRNHLGTHHLKIIVADLDRTRFRRVTPDITILLQCLQVRVDRRS